MNARAKYVARLAVVAIVGFLLILPWTLSWIYLTNHLVNPYVQNHLCCLASRADSTDAFFNIYVSFAAVLAGIFSLASSLILGVLVRPAWLVPWAVFCASAAFSLRDAANSKLLGPVGALFVAPDAALIAFVLASGLGFWITGAPRASRDSV